MTTRPSHRASLWIVGLCLLPAPAPAQGTKADYDRAATLGQRTRDSVFRDRVRPEWIAGGPRFWYRVATAPGRHEFVVVDPEKGTRLPAFDHKQLAKALSGAIDRPVDPAALPISGLEFSDEGSLLFRAAGKRFRFDPTKGSLEPAADEAAEPAATRPGTPRASRRTGEETELVFVNRGDGPVELFWLDTEGQKRSYGRLAPGEERAQHTFEGHVWQVSDAQGRELLRVEAGVGPDRVEIDGKARPTADPGPQGEPRGPRRGRRLQLASPNGKWSVIVRDHNLSLVSSDGGEPEALTTDGTEANTYRGEVYWSPDSRYLVAMQVEPAQEHKVHMVESSPRDQVQPRLKTIDYLKPGDKIEHPRPRLFDVEQRKAIPIAEDLFPNPWSIDRVRWDGDSKRFTFLYNQRGHQVLRLVGVDAATGEAKAVVDEVSPTFVDYAHKTYLHWLETSNDLIWMSERDGWNHLYRIDSKTGQVKKQLTQGEWVVRRVDRVDDEKGQLWFWALGIHPGQDPYHEHLARVDLDGSNLVVLTEGDGTHRVEFSPGRDYLIDSYSRVDLPTVTEVRRASDGERIVELERADASALLGKGWTMPERFVAKGRDGETDIYGVIYTPSTLDPSKKYPVIEQIYAGPQGFHVPKAWGLHLGPHELAELGFIVVQIDGMGTNWRSKAFHDVCWKNLGDAGFPDRIAWMRAAAESRPWMDLTRVGVYGGSAGGQNAMGALLFHPDFYKVAAADCGCHDNRMDKIWWNELWMGYPVGPEYEASSNVVHAPKLQGKLLLIVGELDTNVDPASTMQVVDALVRADKDFDLLIVPGAGHGAGGSPYGRRRQRDFFVRHLLGVEPRQP